MNTIKVDTDINIAQLEWPDRLIKWLSKDIKLSISFWQKSMDWDFEWMTEDEIKQAKNIHKWYKNTKRHFYRSKKVNLKKYQIEIIEKHKRYEYYKFKKLIEILIRKLVKDYFSNIPGSAIVYNTSDSDDIFSWLDLIIALWKEFYWIDICCTENYFTIQEKLNKSWFVSPIEFNLFKNNDPKMEIPRLIFPIPYSVISRFIELSMSEISNTWQLLEWKTLDFFEISWWNKKWDLLQQIIILNTQKRVSEQLVA